MKMKTSNNTTRLFCFFENLKERLSIFALAWGLWWWWWWWPWWFDCMMMMSVMMVIMMMVMTVMIAWWYGDSLMHFRGNEGVSLKNVTQLKQLTLRDPLRQITNIKVKRWEVFPWFGLSICLYPRPHFMKRIIDTLFIFIILAKAIVRTILHSSH